MCPPAGTRTRERDTAGTEHLTIQRPGLRDERESCDRPNRAGTWKVLLVVPASAGSSVRPAEAGTTNTESRQERPVQLPAVAYGPRGGAPGRPPPPGRVFPGIPPPSPGGG